MVVYHGSGENEFDIFEKGNEGFHFGSYDQAMPLEDVVMSMMESNPKGWESIKDKLKGTTIWHEVVIERGK